MKIGIAYKLSKLDWDIHRLGLSREEVIETYRQQEKDVDKILKSHKRQNDCIDSILAENSNAEIVDMIRLLRGEIAIPEVDLLISIGGDNFFQICAYHFPNAYLVGVNSDPETSHGALLNFDYESLQKNLTDIVNENFEHEEWTRIATTLNGQRVKDANCTVALSIKATDMISRYLLKLNGESEEQKATGVLVVSGAGSGKFAWYRNAGVYLPMLKSGFYPETTKEFSKTSGVLKTLTREPFGADECSYKWLNRTVNPGDKLTLIYWAHDPSELSIDSIKRYDVKEGDVLTFKESDRKLKVVRR
jgi:NAD kinase